MRKAVTSPLLALAVAAMLAAGGCAIPVSSSGKAKPEWTGTYQRQQAERRDRDRDIALRVRTTLNEDPVLGPLDLHIFVNQGEVTLCGHFPNAKTRDRAIALAGQVTGVEGVDTDCGKN